MTLKNIRVRNAIVEAGVRYRDLADALGVHPTILSAYLRNELADSVQDEMIEKVWEIKAKNESVHGV